MQYQAQEDAHEMLREPRRILEETQKVFAEISKERAAATISSSPPDSAVGMETDSAQETAGMNPDAIDSVPCCGALTELPPLLEMAMGKTSGNAETELAERLPEDAPVEGALEHELEKIIEQMPEGARVKMQYYLY